MACDNPGHRPCAGDSRDNRDSGCAEEAQIILFFLFLISYSKNPGDKTIIYATDLAIEIVRNLGGESTEPAMFHRDGHLFVATEQGFGIVRTGISAWAREGSEKHKEIAESQDALRKSSGSKGPSFIKGESEHFRPIVFGRDDSPTFSLETIAQTARALGALPDDKNIRMAEHSTSYSSHKHGYAADGINVHLLGARVMDCARYLELAREKEEESYVRMERMAIELEKFIEPRRRYSWIEENYKGIRLPDCIILTPYMLAMFPRNGYVETDYRTKDVWTQETHFCTGYGDARSSFGHDELDSYRESPFAVKRVVNTHSYRSRNTNDFMIQNGEFLEGIGRHTGALTLVMDKAAELMNRLNSLHNAVKELRE